MCHLEEYNLILSELMVWALGLKKAHSTHI